LPKNTPPAAAETALTTATEPTGLALVQQIIESIASADDDPTERMASFILTHPPEQWDELWAGLPNVKNNIGESFTVSAIRARESDFEGPVGVYLICDVLWDRSGEYGLLSVSSQMGMVQLLALYKGGKLPAHLQIVAKSKPTKAGFTPIHFRYLGGGEAALGDPGEVVSEQ